MMVLRCVMICSYEFILVDDQRTSKVNKFVITKEGWGGYSIYYFRRKVISVLLKISVEESPE